MRPPPGEGHLASVSWPIPSGTAQQHLRSQGPGITPNASDHAVGDQLSPSPGTWDQGGAGGALASAHLDLHRQRILMAAHERAVDLMQQRHAWQNGQVWKHRQLAQAAARGSALAIWLS